ncbi:MAG: TonB family protein [Phenylobacterium sp.]|uniref:energy transducer TonB family protein n=1 Tax=Phenylobacterium sp. TaxID=1871053 RepID=UPI0025F9ADB1|nr:energy transducer TonB [Phenylobacterium sp.]MBI1196934.1 TonB family protein [Phenylobacterium sp.]
MLHLIALATAAVTSAAAVQAAPTPALREVEWIATPTGQDIASVYPPTAVKAGKSGAVLLECRVAAEGSLDGCSVEIEDPVGLEFGLAAMELAPLFRMTATAPDGTATAGRTIRIPIMFQITTNGD